MELYQTHVTGEGVQPMDLEFTNITQYQKWSRHVTDIRNEAAFVLTLQLQAKIIYLQSTWIPLAELLVQDWDNNFIPSDITTNLEEASQFLDRSPPPNPALLRILREICTDKLHAAHCRKNKEH